MPITPRRSQRKPKDSDLHASRRRLICERATNQTIYLASTQSIGVITQGALAHTPTDVASFHITDVAQVSYNVFRGRSHQYFLVGLKEGLDAVPCICDQTCPRARRLEDASGR